MFTFSRTRAVMLALGQVWLIVAGTLVSGMAAKLFIPDRLPMSIRLLKSCGAPLLLLPLAWITLTMAVHYQSKMSEQRRALSYTAGWALLFGLFVFIVYALIRPFTMSILLIGTTPEGDA